MLTDSLGYRHGEPLKFSQEKIIISANILAKFWPSLLSFRTLALGAR